jgi:hypothetical protein
LRYIDRISIDNIVASRQVVGNVLIVDKRVVDCGIMSRGVIAVSTPSGNRIAFHVRFPGQTVFLDSVCYVGVREGSTTAPRRGITIHASVSRCNGDVIAQTALHQMVCVTLSETVCVGKVIEICAVAKACLTTGVPTSVRCNRNAVSVVYLVIFKHDDYNVVKPFSYWRRSNDS